MHLLLSITCSIVCGAAKKKAAETKDDWECRSYTKVVTRVKWIATIGALVILIIALVIGGIRVVDETEVGVVKTFGEISGTAEAAIAQAKGEAEALEITRQALQNMPDTWVQQLWIEKWDGKLPTTQAGSDAAIIVNPNMGN